MKVRKKMTVGYAECCFCDTPLGISVVGSNRIIADYCKRCGEKYTKELGAGWERSGWAQDYFKSHRRLMRVEQNERNHIRLDSDGAQELDAEDVIRPEEDITKRAIRIIYDAKKCGASEIHRELIACGFRASLSTVWRKLQEVKGEVRPVSKDCLGDVDITGITNDGKVIILINGYIEIRAGVSLRYEYLHQTSGRGMDALVNEYEADELTRMLHIELPAGVWLEKPALKQVCGAAKRAYIRMLRHRALQAA